MGLKTNGGHKLEGVFGENVFSGGAVFSYDEPSKLSCCSWYCSTQSTHYENVDIGELLTTLRETDNLDEQGDILQYIFISK